MAEAVWKDRFFVDIKFAEAGRGGEGRRGERCDEERD